MTYKLTVWESTETAQNVLEWLDARLGPRMSDENPFGPRYQWGITVTCRTIYSTLGIPVLHLEFTDELDAAACKILFPAHSDP